MAATKIKSEHMYPEGKVWVALDEANTKVLACVAKSDVTMEQRKKLLDKLGSIGKVGIGEIIHENGACFFVRTITGHAERSKTTHQFSIPLSEPISPGRYYAALSADETTILGLVSMKASKRGRRLSLEDATAQLNVGANAIVVLGAVNQASPESYVFNWSRGTTAF